MIEYSGRDTLNLHNKSISWDQREERPIIKRVDNLLVKLLVSLFL